MGKHWLASLFVCVSLRVRLWACDLSRAPASMGNHSVAIPVHHYPKAEQGQQTAKVRFLDSLSGKWNSFLSVRCCITKPHGFFMFLNIEELLNVWMLAQKVKADLGLKFSTHNHSTFYVSSVSERMSTWQQKNHSSTDERSSDRFLFCLIATAARHTLYTHPSEYSHQGADTVLIV